MATTNEKNRRLLEGVTVVFIANVIGSAFTVALNFMLPKYLTVEAYAGIKLYQLLVTYVGLFHFGFADGVYLEYGGQELSELSSEELSLRINSLRWLELAIMPILIVISLFVQDTVFLYFSISMPMINMVGFFQLFYQATGEYKRYSRILNCTTILRTIISILILCFLTKSDYNIFLIGYVSMYLILWLWQEIQIKRMKTATTGIRSFSLNLVVQEVKSGISLRIGLLSGFLLSSMDRIFVKATMGVMPFALYSFAATVENMLNVLITPITTTMYYYFCDDISSEQQKKVSRIISIASIAMLAFFFPTKIIVTFYLENYIESLDILMILFAAKSLYIIIQGVYLNLYKATKRQKIYMNRLFIVIAVGLISNILSFAIVGTVEGYAVATLLTTIIWLLICMMDFNEARLTIVELAYLFGMTIFYILMSKFVNPVVGLLLFVLAFLVVTRFLFHEELGTLISYVRHRSVV